MCSDGLGAQQSTPTWRLQGSPIHLVTTAKCLGVRLTTGATYYLAKHENALKVRPSRKKGHVSPAGLVVFQQVRGDQSTMEVGGRARHSLRECCALSVLGHSRVPGALPRETGTWDSWAVYYGGGARGHKLVHVRSEGSGGEGELREQVASLACHECGPPDAPAHHLCKPVNKVDEEDQSASRPFRPGSGDARDSEPVEGVCPASGAAIREGRVVGTSSGKVVSGSISHLQEGHSSGDAF